ncbi:MAG: discoidin domain-containing protein [Fibrobacteres bacterium]|nr:discoidin domain-containing protein [Fibrobacterota bacterium]
MKILLGLLLAMVVSLYPKPFMDIIKNDGLVDTVDLKNSIKFSFNPTEMVFSVPNKTVLLDDINTIVFDLKGMNVAYQSTVTSLSTLENDNWRRECLVNGTRISTPGDNGYTSNDSTDFNHTEWIVLELSDIFLVNRIVLYGRNDAGNVGAGFPNNFTLQLSMDNLHWNTVAVETAYPKPDSSGQSFRFPEQEAKYVRIFASNLRTSNGLYRLQFAEIEVYDTIVSNTVQTEQPVASALSIAPQSYELSSASPNPFNGTTCIQFAVPKGQSGKASEVNISLYDARGRLVKTLVNGAVPGGHYSVNFSMVKSSQRQLVSSVYFCRMQGKNFMKTIKLLLMR